MTIERLQSLAGRSLITFFGILVVWMGVTMFAGDTLIAPSAGERYLEEGDERVEIGSEREQHFWLWLSSQAARFASGGLLLGLGGVLVVKPWTKAKAGSTKTDDTPEQNP